MKRDVVIITGATGAIGNAVARDLAAEQLALLLVASSSGSLTELRSKWATGGEQIFASAHDLRDSRSSCALFDECAAKLGPPNHLIMCHGFGEMSSVMSTSDQSLQKMIEMNLLSVFRLCQQAARSLLPGGSITMLGSSAGIQGEKGMAAYGMTKGALKPLVESLAQELAPKKIRVNIVSPGYIPSRLSSEMYKYLPPSQLERGLISNHPLGMGAAADVANLVSFLVSVKARWITGQLICVDGGYSIRR